MNKWVISDKNNKKITIFKINFNYIQPSKLRNAKYFIQIETESRQEILNSYKSENNPNLGINPKPVNQFNKPKIQ